MLKFYLREQTDLGIPQQHKILSESLQRPAGIALPHGGDAYWFLVHYFFSFWSRDVSLTKLQWLSVSFFDLMLNICISYRIVPTRFYNVTYLQCRVYAWSSVAPQLFLLFTLALDKDDFTTYLILVLFWCLLRLDHINSIVIANSLWSSLSLFSSQVIYRLCQKRISAKSAYVLTASCRLPFNLHNHLEPCRILFENFNKNCPSP